MLWAYALSISCESCTTSRVLTGERSRLASYDGVAGEETVGVACVALGLLFRRDEGKSEIVGVKLLLVIDSWGEVHMSVRVVAESAKDNNDKTCLMFCQ